MTRTARAIGGVIICEILGVEIKYRTSEIWSDLAGIRPQSTRLLLIDQKAESQLIKKCFPRRMQTAYCRFHEMREMYYTESSPKSMYSNILCLNNNNIGR